jgi:hypothetical protein
VRVEVKVKPRGKWLWGWEAVLQDEDDHTIDAAMFMVLRTREGALHRAQVVAEKLLYREQRRRNLESKSARFAVRP